MSDGSLLKYGPYSSYDYAFNRLTRILMGGWEPDGYVDVDILELPIPPNFMLFDTVGTRAEAEQLAGFLQTFGLLTKIKRVSTLQLND